MEYLVKAHGIAHGDTQSPLSRVSFDRQKDVFRLAKRGDARCRRLWEDFAGEQPAMARLVVADCDSDKSLAVAANKHLDVVLSKAEKVTKSAKKAKPDIKKSRGWKPPKPAKPATVNKVNKIIAGQVEARQQALQASMRASVARELSNPDPVYREAGYAATVAKAGGSLAYGDLLLKAHSDDAGTRAQARRLLYG